MTDMLDHARGRMREFQRRLADHGLEVAVLTDESSIAYLAGFWATWVSSSGARPSWWYDPTRRRWSSLR